MHYIGSRPHGVDIDICLLNMHVGQGDRKAWTRVDLGSNTCRTTTTGGTAWKDVVLRFSSCAGIGELVSVEQKEHITRSLEHGLIKDGPMNLQTTLIYKGGNAKATEKERTTTATTAVPATPSPPVQTTHTSDGARLPQRTSHHTTCASST